MSNCCSICEETKPKDQFTKGKLTCRECINCMNRAKRAALAPDPSKTKECSKCHIVQPETDFVKIHNICKGCNRTRKREENQTESAYTPIAISENKECFSCRVTKPVTMFPKSLIYYSSHCFDCSYKHHNERYRKKREELPQTIPEQKTCDNCHIEKEASQFTRRNRRTKHCMDCNKEKQVQRERRKQKYHSDEEYRNKLLSAAVVRAEEKAYQTEIGAENRCCRYCKEVKPLERFRHNNRKCRECQRHEPLNKFKRIIRTSIYNHLRNYSKKNKHTVDYLGCNTDDYEKWLSINDSDYTIENHGKRWHIDHVIPLSRFDLNDPAQIDLAFNWRNTMPLSVKENLQKNNKLVRSQIEQHYHKLMDYHKKENLEMPNEFIEMFAKFLVVRETP